MQQMQLPPQPLPQMQPQQPQQPQTPAVGAPPANVITDWSMANLNAQGKRRCYFFFNMGGCRNGDKCSFAHD